jgi:hypothetical protein
MKTKFSFFSGISHYLGTVVSVGTIISMAVSAQAQNLFEADYGSDNIYEFTLGGVAKHLCLGVILTIWVGFPARA